MSTLDLLKTLAALAAHPSRALLTLLGIVIGAGSIVLVASLIRGGEDALIRTNQGATDSDLVTLSSQRPPPAERDKPTRALSGRDAEAIARSRTTGGASVGSESSRRLRAEHAGRHKNVTLASGDERAPELYRLRLAHGRFIDADDVAERRRVAVVGAEVWRELLDSAPMARGLSIDAGGERFSVVGVLAEKPILGSTTSTNIWDRKLMIPKTTYRGLFAPDGSVDRIRVRRAGAMPLPALRAAVDVLMLRRHLGVKNFHVDDPEKHSQERVILAVIRLLLLGTGLVALFTGGINVMNVMLVSVTERTREIGVRRALGAPRRAIVSQFLLESSALSALGGIVGVLGGSLAAGLSALALDHALGQWLFRIEPWSVALALGSSLVTGVCFGLLPALRAARVDPIAALRFE